MLHIVAMSIKDCVCVHVCLYVCTCACNCECIHCTFYYAIVTICNGIVLNSNTVGQIRDMLSPSLMVILLDLAPVHYTYFV